MVHRGLGVSPDTSRDVGVYIGTMSKPNLRATRAIWGECAALGTFSITCSKQHASKASYTEREAAERETLFNRLSMPSGPTTAHMPPVGMSAVVR
jgi:hypothetical protein